MQPQPPQAFKAPAYPALPLTYMHTSQAEAATYARWTAADLAQGELLVGMDLHSPLLQMWRAEPLRACVRGVHIIPGCAPQAEHASCPHPLYAAPM